MKTVLIVLLVTLCSFASYGQKKPFLINAEAGAYVARGTFTSDQKNVQNHQPIFPATLGLGVQYSHYWLYTNFIALLGPKGMMGMGGVKFGYAFPLGKDYTEFSKQSLSVYGSLYRTFGKGVKDDPDAYFLPGLGLKYIVPLSNNDDRDFYYISPELMLGAKKGDVSQLQYFAGVTLGMSIVCHSHSQKKKSCF